MTDQNHTADTCRCCKGLKAQTSLSVYNSPGLSAIACRVGTHSSFKAAMISGLSSDPVLMKLTTRDDSDPSIALIDAWALVLDVLTFYQERIAEEGYLRTAKERCSIIELASSIGYRLKPGVAAGTYLAFELETAQGAPQSAKIDVGTRAQSLPGQNETPQIFETIESIEAKPEWNKLFPQMTVPQSIELGLKKLYLKSTGTQLQPGDAIVILGSARENSIIDEEWDLRIVGTVKADTDRNQTIITLDRELGTNDPKTTYPAKVGTRVFALRQRASLFGYNAPDFLSMPDKYYDKGNDEWTDWRDFRIQTAPQNIIDLDRVYPKITEGSWIVLKSPKEVELYQVRKAMTFGRKDFGLTGTVSRFILDSKKHLHRFGLRETVVFAQSEELLLDDIPLTSHIQNMPSEKVILDEGTLTPVEGAQVTLDREIKGLQNGRAILVSGKRIRAKLLEDLSDLGLNKDDILQVMNSPESGNGKLSWHLRDSSGNEYSVATEPGKGLALISAKEDDEIVTEVALIGGSTTDSIGSGHTILYLEKALEKTYDRKTVIIYANVASATNGASTEEVLGHGDASQLFQKFVLKQSPLTYTQAPISGGGISTLKITVNDVKWEEVPSFYGLDGQKQVYITRIGDDGKTTVQFGDGITGARLPTGAEIKANYRTGTGLQGLVKANQITLLMTRPLGVKGVNNPGRPEGAENPEPRDQARQNAPSTVLTFGRVVSLRDYEDFARAFSGIGKAKATWLWEGVKRVVQITVAAAGGGEMSTSSNLINNLKTAIADVGDPHQPVSIIPYNPVYFDVNAEVLIYSNRYRPDKVLAAIKSALEDAFSFEKRSFGQKVDESGLLMVIQSVEGVQAANLKNTNIPAPVDATMLLMINPAKIVLEEMKL